MDKRVFEFSLRITLMVSLSSCISYDSMLRREQRNLYSQDELVDWLALTANTETPRKALTEPFENQPPFLIYPVKEEHVGSSERPNYGLIAFVIAIIALVISFYRLLFDMVKTLVQIAVKAAITDTTEQKVAGTTERIKEEKKHLDDNKDEHNPTPPSHEE